MMNSSSFCVWKYDIRRNRVVAITGDCKSPAFRLRRFESYFRHQNSIFAGNCRPLGRFFSGGAVALATLAVSACIYAISSVGTLDIAYSRNGRRLTLCLSGRYHGICADHSRESAVLRRALRRARLHYGNLESCLYEFVLTDYAQHHGTGYR